MPPTDSYDALAASIERALRHGNSEDAEAGLSAAIQRALLEEARLGELSIAVFRLPVVVVCGLLSVALVALGAAGSTIAGVAITALVWGLWSIVLLVALRRGWYRLWLRHGLPIADAIMIASVIA